MPEPLNSLALVALGLAGGSVAGFILAAIARLMPGRRSLGVWAVVGGATVAWLLASFGNDLLAGLGDTALAEPERRELLDTAAFAAGLSVTVVAGFVLGIVMRARALRQVSAKPALLPPKL